MNAQMIHNETIIPPSRCPMQRRMTIKDVLLRLFGLGIDTRCMRYAGHAKHGYKHEDCDGKEF